MTYAVNFIVLALVPVVLAAIGAHLAGTALDNPKRRNTLLLVWGLAGFGLIFAAVQQVQAYNSDTKHDHEQEKIQTKLDDTTKRLEQSARNEENVKGQLTSLALVMSTVVTSLAKSGSVGQDAIKAWASAVSTAIAQIAKNAQTQSQPSPPAIPPQTNPPLSPTNIDLKRSADVLTGEFHRFNTLTSDEYGRLSRDHLPKVYAAKDNKAETDKETARYQAAIADMMSQRSKQFAPLRARALILRTQLLSRLPPQPADDASKSVLDDGNFDVNSASFVLNYLIKLAALLAPEGR